MPLPELNSRNGTGRALLGLRQQPDGSFTATVWDTRAHVPIRPVSRHRLRLLADKTDFGSVGLEIRVAHTRRLELVEDLPLSPDEIRRTRLSTWLAWPIVLLAPAVVTLVAYAMIDDLGAAHGYKPGQAPATAFLASAVWASLVWQLYTDIGRKAFLALRK